MYKFDELASPPKPHLGFAAPPKAMIDEIHNHLVYVLKEKLDWMDASSPELSAGGGHVVIRFERGGRRYVFRVGKHGVYQHRRTMLAYRHIGHLGFIPEKIYHDGVSLIESNADGAALSETVSELVLGRLAEGLSRMHSLAAQGFGPLDFDTQGAFVDAASYYEAQSQVDVDWSETDLSEKQAKELRAAVVRANTPPLKFMQGSVCLGHGDLWANNIMVTATDFRILDWDRIGAYPLERDLAFLLELDFSYLQRQQFFDRYALTCDLNADLLRWFATRHVLRDRGLRLENKLTKIRKIQRIKLPNGSKQP